MVGQNRRALSKINRNVMGGPPLHTAVVPKRNDITENKVNAATNKIPPVLIHRPVTRKLATQISSQQRHPAVEVHTFKESEDCIIIDAEDYKTTSNSSVSMFVQHQKRRRRKLIGW